MLARDEAHLPFTAEQRAVAYRDTMWRALLVAAIVLLIAELVVKQVLFPVGSARRFGRPRAAGRGRPARRRAKRERRGPHRPPPDYAEFRRQVAEHYRREDVTNRDPPP